MEQRAERGSADRIAAGGQCAVAVVPRVAERVVAVRDVGRVLVADDRVGPGARARDDQVEAGQVERLDRGGIQRQERAEGARAWAEALEERGVDLPVGEPPLRAVLVVDGREQVGLRIEVADRREDPLRAAYVEQEVVDERDPAVLHARGTLSGG